MAAARIVLLGLLSCFTNAAHTTAPPTDHQLLHNIQQQLNTLTSSMSTFETSMKAFQTSMQQKVSGLARQMMLQQLFVEERIRSDGDSGVKQIRAGNDGNRAYLTNSLANGAVCNMHDHANYPQTIGLGELEVVLNGIDFRTRHNDYKMKMPSRSKSDYNLVEDVPFPPVPHSVTNKHTVAEQIAEMKQYFKAFHKQDTKIRDYKPYFKPVLCYLEGGWTTDTKTLVEPFHSERHFVDASSWMDLQEKIRFTSATGGKSVSENYSFLPTTIINVTADGEPVYAQWNYRILCHPIKEQVGLKDLNLVDDLQQRMKMRRNFTQFGQTKSARFRMANNQGREFHEADGYGKDRVAGYRFGLLDRIMYEIPGKDNYKLAEGMTDNNFEELKYRVDTKNSTVLRTGFYHRWFKSMRKGAMGLTVRHRGYSDSNLWVAQTTSPRIANMAIQDCHNDPRRHRRVCHQYEKRTTYAIPLELIWLTPLSTWNPYNLKYQTNVNVPIAGGRNGGMTHAKAYNGTSKNNYYLTPAEFFHGGEVERDPADTASNAVGVLDQHGQVRHMSASGIRIFLPEIPGVGKVRTRYPIMPRHDEGSSTYKELSALQEIVMDMKTYTKMFEARPEVKDLDGRPDDLHFATTTTHNNPPGMHRHDVYITQEELHALQKNGTTVHVYTSENNGHQHELELRLEHPLTAGQTHPNRLQVMNCDGQRWCWDGHGGLIFYQRDSK